MPTHEYCTSDLVTAILQTLIEIQRYLGGTMLVYSPICNAESELHATLVIGRVRDGRSRICGSGNIPSYSVIPS